MNLQYKTKKIFLMCFALILTTMSLAQNLEFSTYLASSEQVHSTPNAITDKNGNIFVVGGTRSGLKITDNAFQKDYKGHSNSIGGDIFLMKLSPSGELLYSSYIGAAGNEAYCEQIVTDDSGNVYLAITTDSKGLPVSENAIQKYNKGYSDQYIIKFNNNCEYLASTYFGGNRSDHDGKLAINNNILYLIASTKSPDYPITENAIQKKYQTWKGEKPAPQYLVKDIAITAFTLDLDKVLYSTFLGGHSGDGVSSFHFDKDGNLVLTGGTKSEDFPTTQNAYNKTINGEFDVFVTILKQDLSEIIYSTFLGGKENEFLSSILSFDGNEIVLAGYTKSTDFPVTPDAVNNKFFGGPEKGFITKLNINSNELLYSSYLGGTGSDYFTYAAKTSKNNFVLVGESSSTDLPVTDNAFDKSSNGEKDLMIMILDNSLKKIEYLTYVGGSKDDCWQTAPTAKITKDDKLLIVTITSSLDFPTTKKIEETPSFEMINLLKFNFNDY